MSYSIFHIGGCADGQWLPDAGKYAGRERYVLPSGRCCPALDRPSHEAFEIETSSYEKHTFAFSRDRFDDVEVYVVEGWTPRDAFLRLMRYYQPSKPSQP